MVSGESLASICFPCHSWALDGVKATIDDGAQKRGKGGQAESEEWSYGASHGEARVSCSRVVGWKPGEADMEIGRVREVYDAHKTLSERMRPQETLASAESPMPTGRPQWVLGHLSTSSAGSDPSQRLTDSGWN